MSFLTDLKSFFRVTFLPHNNLILKNLYVALKNINYMFTFYISMCCVVSVKNVYYIY